MGKCDSPCPTKTREAMADQPIDPDARIGARGGHFDRPNPDEERKAWNSDDEEFDEFGRKKRKGANPQRQVEKSDKQKAASDKQKAALERLRQRAGGAGRRAS